MNDDYIPEQYKKIAEAAAEFQRKRAEYLEPLLATINQYLASYSAHTERINDTRTLNEELTAKGWCIAPVLLDLPVHEVESLKGLSQEKVDEKFILFLRRNDFALLHHMHTSWNDINLYQKRASIIDAAVKAHREEIYELSVPAIALLIEGILSEIVGSKEFNPQNHLRKLFNKLKQHSTSYELYIKEDELFINLLIHQMFGSNVQWSRHAIAHNFLPIHATEINSTRLLYMLDKIFKDLNQTPTLSS